ncbi:MAG: calcium-binding protein [Alphaproteobacteria bacterium]
MANVTVFSSPTEGIDLLSADEFDLSPVVSITVAPTQVTALYDDGATNIYDGFGFEGNGLNITAGTATALTVDDLGPVFTVTGFSIAATTIDGFYDANDGIGLRDLLLAGNDTITSGAGNDALPGLAGDDVIQGGAGNDQLLGGLGNDQLFGEAGDDTLSGEAGDDLLVGGVGDDILLPGSNTNVDRISPGEGNDTVNFTGAGLGFFVVDYEGITSGITANFVGDAGTVTKTSGTDSFLNVATIDGIVGGGGHPRHICR